MLEPTAQRRLLESVRSGDRSAAEELVEGTYRQVFSSLVRLTGGDAELAADLTQETYRKAWQSLPRFDGRSAFATWLYRIGYNTFLNHIRRPALLQPLEERARREVVDPAPGTEETLGRSEVAERLRRAVIGLPEDLRFTVSARFWAELRVEEIARLENITGAAVRKRLKKAMTRLRQRLEEDPS